MTRAEFNALKGAKQAPVQAVPQGVKTMSRADFNALKGGVKTMSRAEFNAKTTPQQSGAFNWTMNQLIKPISSASNLLEDTGKSIGYGIAKLAGSNATWDEAKNKLGIDFLGHQGGVFNGTNKRTYSDIMNEAGDQQSNPILKYGQKTIGYGGDFMLDPLNEVSVLGKTAKGVEALKAGELALSAGEQAQKGERALLQIGKYNVLPSVGNKVLEGSTKLNDAIRGTKVGSKVMDIGAELSSKIRPGAVSREDFKILSDAESAARNTLGYTQDKAIEFAKGIAKDLKTAGSSDAEGAYLLHAIEKGDPSLVPKGLENIYKKGVEFKTANEDLWKQLGGSTLEGHGLSHVATDAVAEQARKDAFKGQGGFKLTSTNTPQDIHRQWVKVGELPKAQPLQEGGKVSERIANLGDEGIKFENGKYFDKAGKEVNVSQASAMEINNARTAQGKAPLFKEDLPIVAAKMGISTGKKQAATEFLKATAGLKGGEAIKLAQETHDKMVNPESLRKAIQMFDSVQNIWKAQALVAPSYHIRNFAGNLWNNFLADVKTPAYAIAGDLQNAMRTGKLSEAQAKLVKEMETHGVIGTGQYGSDIAKTIENGVGKTSINPLSQNFAGYKLNKFIGGGVEDNAKIAHFLSKRAEGYGAQQAAESVKKYLFDYGDLTSTEKGLLKRVMPFYTWTSKNIPLQVQQFVENPGKFSKIATAKKNVEQGVAQPNEKYMSDYMSGNAPIRVKKDANGNTLYFLAGAWLPAAQAITFLSDPVSNALGMVTPAVKLPYENLTGKGTFFKDTLGNYEDIQKYPGQKTSYLGLDMNPQTVNNLRSIRPLNELNNLNPFGMFGTQNSPSILKGILPNASNVRGGQFSPQTSQSDRVANAFVGKLQGYNPEDSQKYYDRDTQGKVTEFKTAIDRAISNDQVDLAKGLIKQMSEFVQSRDGKPNKDMQMYNLLGDQYFQDQAQNKQAEKQRGYIREDMKKQIRQGLASNDTNLIMEALKKDPTYAQQALKDAIMEQQTQSDEQQKLLYQINQAKTQKRLNPFYSK